MGAEPQNHGKVAKILGTIVLQLYAGNRKNKKIQRIENEYKNNGEKSYVATYFGRDVTLPISIIYPKTWFDNSKYLKFEDMEVPCSGNLQKYCALQYGKTYMQLPPEEKQKPYHNFNF